MFDLGGSFSGFVDTVMSFVSSLLSGLFNWLSAMLGGINIG